MRCGVSRCSLDIAFWLNLNYMKPLLHNAVLLMIQSDSDHWIRRIVSSTSYRYFPRAEPFQLLGVYISKQIHSSASVAFAHVMLNISCPNETSQWKTPGFDPPPPKSRARCGSVHEQPRWWMTPSLSWRVLAVKMEVTVKKIKKGGGEINRFL